MKLTLWSIAFFSYTVMHTRLQVWWSSRTPRASHKQDHHLGHQATHAHTESDIKPPPSAPIHLTSAWWGANACAPPSPPAEPSYLDDSVHTPASEHLTFSLTSNNTWQRLSTPKMTFAMYYFFPPSHQWWSTGGRFFFASTPRWGQQFHHPQGGRDGPVKHLCHQNSASTSAIINFALSEFLYSWTPFKSIGYVKLFIHSLWSFLTINSWSTWCLWFFDLTPTKPGVQLNHQPTLFNTLDQ